MILRIWRGWTAPEDAAAYERFLTDPDDGLLTTMAADGYRGFELGRHDDGDEVAFVTILRFADYDAVEAFAGENYEQAHVPEEAREFLSRWEEDVAHYERRAGEDAAD